MDTYKIMLIGIGGVGSYIAGALNRYKQNNQLININEILLVDDNTVDTKNLIYQNFTMDDILEPKSKVLGKKYGFNYLVQRIDIKNDKNLLDNYNLIITSVDGTKFRKDFFKYAFKKENLYWIDVRAEGHNVLIYNKHQNNTYERMLNTLPTTDKEDGSCQYDADLEAGIVQGGNVIAAEITAQYVLNVIRKFHILNPPKFASIF